MGMALVVIDMLNDFVTEVHKCERASRIVPKIRCLLDFTRNKGTPVIYTNDAHLPDVDKEFELWPPHAVVRTRGAEVIDELKPREGDYIIRKRRYSAFYKTHLALLLWELNVDKLVLVGLVTNVCFQHTAADAYFRGYHIFVSEDCVEAFTEEEQKTGIKYLKTFYGCEISNLHGFMKMEMV